MPQSILCFIGFHDYHYQIDAGFRSAVQLSSGIKCWMSEVKVFCGNCKNERPAKHSSDHQLPELMEKSI